MPWTSTRPRADRRRGLLAKDLRRRYGLPAFEPVWDFTDTLESARRSAMNAREESRKNQAELHKTLDAIAASTRLTEAAAASQRLADTTAGKTAAAE